MILLKEAYLSCFYGSFLFCVCSLYLVDDGFGRAVGLLLGECLDIAWLVLNLSVSGSISLQSSSSS